MRSTYVRDKLAQAYAAEATHLSFHSADPGATGANEQVHARMPISWVLTPNTGRLDAIVTTTLTTTTNFLGFWNQAIGGSYIDSVEQVAPAGTHDFVLTYQQP